MLREKLKNRKGFTLIEIIVVIVILAVLMAVAVPSVMSYIGEGNKAKYESVARTVLVNTQTEYAKAVSGAYDESKATGNESALIDKVKEKVGTEKGTHKYGEGVAVSVTDIQLTTGANAEDQDIKSVQCDITINGAPKTVTITTNKKVTIS